MSPLAPHVYNRPPISRLPGMAGIRIDPDEAVYKLEHFIDVVTGSLAQHLQSRPHLDPSSLGQGYREFATELNELLDQLHARMSGELENLRNGAETALRQVIEIIEQDRATSGHLQNGPFNVVLSADPRVAMR